MQANETDLKAGIKGTKAQLKRLQSVSKFLDAAGKLIGIVAKIAAL